MEYEEKRQKDWEFLQLKAVELEDDGTSEEKPAISPPWKAKMIRELLDKITPPETLKAGQRNYKCMVSDVKATRNEVKKLGQKVKTIIEKEKFASTGICEERHAMYSALFDELIRQIVIEFPELGIILLKIRDHFRQEIWNYEEVYNASQAYGLRKLYMQDADERLNELEAERKDLLERQEKAAEEVEKVHAENRQKIQEYDMIGVDEDDYMSEAQFYHKYIKFLLRYFDIRTEDDKSELGQADSGAELQEEEEKIEEEEKVEGDESGSEIDEEILIQEEEEEVPRGPGDDKGLYMEIAKQKEVSKDLIYQEKEEETHAAESDSQESIISQIPETDEDIVSESETNEMEKLQKIFDEELKYDVEFSDIERGYLKKAVDEYYEELKKAKEEEERIKQLKLEQEKLEQMKAEQTPFEQQKAERRKLKERLASIREEVEEESYIEEEFEGKELSEETVQLEREKSPVEDMKPSAENEGDDFFYKTEFLKTEEPEEDMPFMTDPKYAIFKRLMAPVKCRDLVPKIREPEEVKKPKDKKRSVKKIKIKRKVQKEDLSGAPELPSELMVDPAEFKWGLPLLVTLDTIDPDVIKLITGGDPTAKPEEGTSEAPLLPSQPTPPPEEVESDAVSSGLTVGKTESKASTEKSDETLSLSADEIEDSIINEEAGEEEEESELFF